MDQLGILGPEKLMDQAVSTAYRYMNEAVRKIDSEFGAGYAKEHPELVAGFIQAASTDFAGSLLAQKLILLTDQIKEAVNLLPEE